MKEAESRALAFQAAQSSPDAPTSSPKTMFKSVLNAAAALVLRVCLSVNLMCQSHVYCSLTHAGPHPIPPAARGVALR
jgi:hypothetical protein